MSIVVTVLYIKVFKKVSKFFGFLKKLSVFVWLLSYSLNSILL